MNSQDLILRCEEKRLYRQALREVQIEIREALRDVSFWEGEEFEFVWNACRGYMTEGCFRAAKIDLDAFSQCLYAEKPEAVDAIEALNLHLAGLLEKIHERLWRPACWYFPKRPLATEADWEIFRLRVLEKLNEAIDRREAGTLTPTPAESSVSALTVKPGMEGLAVKAERRSVIEECKKSYFEANGEKLTARMIATASGHKQTRQLYYWQAGEDRQPGKTGGATRSDDKNFRRVLAMDPVKLKSVIEKLSTKQAHCANL